MLTLLPSSVDQQLSHPPSWFQAVFTGVCVFSILLPAGPIRLSSGALVFGMLFYLLFWTREVSNPAYVAGISSTFLTLRWIDLVAIHLPEKDFWKVNKELGIKAQAPAERWKKMAWFCRLWNTQRGIGWNIESKAIPPFTLSYFKSTFLRQALIYVITNYIALDITQILLKSIYTQHPYPFFSMPLYIQVLIGWAAAFKAYYGICLFYYIGAFLTVVVNIYTPSEWPPAFGTFSNAFTVRKMWGSCWHQWMRRPCGEAGRIVKELCGFRTGSFASRYSQVWAGFTISALAHHTGAMVGGFEDNGFWQCIYFMSQPLAIMGEDFIMFLGRSIGIEGSPWIKRFGFLWVILWFSFSLRAMVAYQPRSWFENLSVTSPIDYILKIGF